MRGVPGNRHPYRDNSMPEPKPPLVVGLDGAYVHAARREPRKEGWFEVIVGKSINAAGSDPQPIFVGGQNI